MKIKNKIINNWGLKLVSFLFAAMVWVVVTNINDPVVPWKVSEVPVSIRNLDLITERGQTYEVLDGTDMIDTVTIYAPRSIIDSLDKSNVVAIADVNDLSSLDTIAIKLSTSKYNDKLESIRGNIDYVKLNIEDKQTRSFPIRANAVGTIREGYMVGDVSTDQNLLKVSGPQSVVSRISKVQADVDVSGFTSNIGTDADIRLYDDEGAEIKSASLEKSITKVRVSVEILEQKTVPIIYTATGVPADGYRLTGESESTRSNVLIAGKSKLIQNIEAIEIPEGVIDVSDAREDVTTLIDIRECLPDGVILAEEDFSGMINVTVFIGQEMRRTVYVNVNNIHISGLTAGFRAEIIDPEDRCGITLLGLASELETVTVSDLEVNVDLAAWLESEETEELEPGYYRIPLTVNLPEDSTVTWEAPEVQIHITEAE
ncbi:MAG: CdaR family protein [Eubacterium sp.]|nr:CdaR family protein [Eubacterium sp.]